MTTEQVAKLYNAMRTPAGDYKAICPAHDDSTPSLSISNGDNGGTVFKCFAGCSFDSIIAAKNLTRGDVSGHERNGKHRAVTKIVAAYDYVDETGNLLFQSVRYEPKDFKQRRPDGKGGWIWGLKGVRRVLYRLPEVIAAVKAGRPVFIAEGEKDCDALVKIGFTATTNPGGGNSKWLADYCEPFPGAEVYIIADKDKPNPKTSRIAGWDHANKVARALHSIATTVRILELPDRNGRAVKDAHDWISAGGEGAELDELVQSAPVWIPEAPKRKSGHDGGETESGSAGIRGTIIEILTNDDLSGTEQRTQIALEVVASLAGRGRFYFHSDLRDFDSAMFFDGERKVLQRIRSNEFVAWLSEWLRVNRADSLFKFIIAAVETAALSSQHTVGILPESYWAARPGVIYLSNGDGSAVKISKDGVHRVDNGTDGVLFAAGKVLAPWKVCNPRDIFETSALFRNAHCDAEHGPELLRAWIYSLPTNPRSKPPACLVGEIGSGKTRLAKGIAEFFGVPFIAQKVEDDSETHFWPSINQGGLFTLDNADTRCKWLADALANAATDGCTQRRKLYTDGETFVLRARAWIIVTTARPTFASDAGLSDRLLVVRMARRCNEESSDEALTKEILAGRDGGLSHLVHTLQAALADTAPTPPGLNQRHPDFAAFAVRIGRAVGRGDQVVAALKAAEGDKARFCLENDPITAALVAHVRAIGSFDGTAAELVPKLIALDPELTDRLSAKRLGKRLSMVWPHLERELSARRDTDRKGFTVFSFKSAECAEFQTAFPQNPLSRIWDQDF